MLFHLPDVLRQLVVGYLSRYKTIMMGCDTQEEHLGDKVISSSYPMGIILGGNCFFCVDFGLLADI